MKHTLFTVLSDNYSGMFYFNTPNGYPRSYSDLVWTSNTQQPEEQYLESLASKLNKEEPVRLLRNVRDKLLTETDKYGLSDYQFETPEIKQAWMHYRQQLRDLTKTCSPKLNANWDLDVSSINLPVKPE